MLHAMEQRYIFYDGNPSYEESNRIAPRTRYRRNTHFMKSTFWRGISLDRRNHTIWPVWTAERYKISDLQQAQRTHCLQHFETINQRRLAISRTELKIPPTLISIFKRCWHSLHQPSFMVYTSTGYSGVWLWPWWWFCSGTSDRPWLATDFSISKHTELKCSSVLWGQVTSRRDRTFLCILSGCCTYIWL